MSSSGLGSIWECRGISSSKLPSFFLCESCTQTIFNHHICEHMFNPEHQLNYAVSGASIMHLKHLRDKINLNIYACMFCFVFLWHDVHVFQLRQYPKYTWFWNENDLTHGMKMHILMGVVELLSQQEFVAKMDAQVSPVLFQISLDIDKIWVMMYLNTFF